MKTIRKDSTHTYEDGIIWDTVFETKEEDDGIYLCIIQKNKQDDIEGINEVEFNKSEMLVLYWHLCEVLGKTET